MIVFPLFFKPQSVQKLDLYLNDRKVVVNLN